MKTLEEVKEHVNKIGYNQLAIHKIEGFLLGNGLLGEGFEMEYMIGERDFDDFRTWFNCKEEKKSEIDWSEFGFGDFIHVQEGVDVVLLGGIHDEKIVCVNDGCKVNCLLVTDETRPCNEDEIESLIEEFNKRGIDFCFVNNEFIRKDVCSDCAGCKVNQEIDSQINKLNEQYKELCDIADSMSDDSPFKDFAKHIVESLSTIVEDVQNSQEEVHVLFDHLEIDSKNAIENIIANLHEGSMGEKEKESVLDALRVLVELGKMYE